ncbi:M23 family metallopeptidase [Nocardia shimofusensis]|uniref:M23 family metallopeptidase n=1 Tax=Nocardia shimofusensis TaxID=228596 RepID=UPI0008356D2C|nr:M23 family metallopeptidase [Nocardia shimofusensis]
MLDRARRTELDRAGDAGGGVVIPPDWRSRAARRPRRGLRHRAAALRRAAGRRAGALSDTAAGLRETAGSLPGRARTELAGFRHRELPDPRQLWTEDKRAEYLRLLLRHRWLIAGLVGVLVLAGADTTLGRSFQDGPLGPNEARRVFFAHPQQYQSTPPSVRRYLQAIANGERLREQAVVAAAARATLERAKAEAAAAAAGEWQPWINEPGVVVTPGSVLPGIGGFVLPARGIFTSGFGSRWGTFHNGIDVAGPIGTPIYAVADGTVVDAGPAQGFGLWVRIRHDDGSITVYGHMYDFFVSVGERVPAGMQIARMGNRGDSTGPHLHFEVIVNGGYVDPSPWLAARGLRY